MIFKIVPTWVWLTAIGALTAALGLQTVRHALLDAEFSNYKAEAEQKARKASEEQRKIETKRQTDVDEEAQNARDEIKALQANVVLLADTADGLRDALAAAKRRARANPSAPVRGAPADTTIDLLAKLYSESDSAEGILAEYADRSRIAGLTCGKAYGALIGDRHE